MKTYDELKAMTTEDLICYVLELQEKSELKERQSDCFYKQLKSVECEYNSFKNSIKSILELTGKDENI